MLCRKFELIPIKIGFFMNVLSFSKILSKITTRKFSTFMPTGIAVGLHLVNNPMETSTLILINLLGNWW